MSRRTEQLSGGLVTSRDGAILAPGELSDLQNAVYYPGNPALQRAAGRVAFGTVTASARPVRGLRDLKFDNGDHFLMAMVASGASAFYSTANVGTATAATFTNVTSTAGSGTALELIHFNNEWFAFNGGANLIFYVSATAAGQALQSRLHGLAPVIATPSYATAVGTWTAGSTGFFEYWTTEVFEYTRDGVVQQLESTFAGTPLTVSVTSTAIQLTIFAPSPPVNAVATKWRVYRAGPKELATDVLFPAGFRIGSDFEFASTSAFTDGGATVGSFVFPNATATHSLGGSAWTNPTSVLASDDARATHTGLGARGVVVVTFADQTLNEPIIGIRLAIEGFKNVGGIGGIQARVSSDGGATWSLPKVVPLPIGAGDTTVLVGNVTGADLWGLNWSAGSFVSSKFRVALEATNSLVNVTWSVDSVSAQITYAGTSTGDTEIPFPAIVLEIDGEVSSVGSHGQPPVASTADIFQGTLVTNTISAPANIVYSLPDEPDYFPTVYFIDFETPDNDRVTCIKTLNNRLGVFLASRFYRVNYLPTEADANFSRGICKEEVSAELGCVNAMCACTYAGSRGQTELAFVSNVGIHSTNLFTITDLTPDLDWRALMSTSATAIALVNDSENSELLFYLRDSDQVLGNECNLCYHLSYDVTHLKPGGRLKISGHVHMRNFATSNSTFADVYSAWPVTNTLGLTKLFIGYGGDTAAATAAGAGRVYRESGNTIPAEDPLMTYATRVLYYNGMGNEWKLGEVYTFMDHTRTTGPQTLQLTPITFKTNAQVGFQGTTKEFAWSGAPLFKQTFNLLAEGAELQFSQASATASANNPLSVLHHIIEGEGFGAEDSGL